MSPRRALGAVLVGGESRRFGSDKAEAVVGGLTLVERAVGILSEAADPVVVVGGDPDPAGRPGRAHLRDRRRGKGPLAGVEAALLEARRLDRAGVVVLACDMPLVPPRLVALLLDEAGGTQAVVPASPGPLDAEPLCAYYALSILPAVQEALTSGEPSMRSLLSQARVRRVPEERLAAFGEAETLFLNVNTPRDRERAEAHLERRTDPLEEEPDG